MVMQFSAYLMCMWASAVYVQKKDQNWVNYITLSGVDAPEVTPIVIGPCGSQFSASISSPCCETVHISVKLSRLVVNKKFKKKSL
jgi:hypothetical protein